MTVRWPTSAGAFGVLRLRMQSQPVLEMRSRDVAIANPLVGGRTIVAVVNQVRGIDLKRVATDLHHTALAVETNGHWGR